MRYGLIRKRVLNNIEGSRCNQLIVLRYRNDKCPHMRDNGGDMDLIAYVTC